MATKSYIISHIKHKVYGKVYVPVGFQSIYAWEDLQIVLEVEVVDVLDGKERAALGVGCGEHGRHESLSVLVLAITSR